MAPAPSVWNPVDSPTTAKARQRYVLNQMVAADFLSPSEASEAYGIELVPVRLTPPAPTSTAPEFTDLVKAQLKQDYREDEDVLFRSGLRITTTLDADLQTALAQAGSVVTCDATSAAVEKVLFA